MTRPLLYLAKPQFIALALILLINWILFPGFFNFIVRDGRVYGSLIDVLNRGAPVAILAIGMTAVIATRGIDLSVGAVMAIAGAVAATMVQGDGNALVIVLIAALGVGLLCGLWNGVLVAVLDLQPIIATLILMVAGRGIAQTITEGFIVTFNDPGLVFLGSGAIFGLPTPIIIMVTLAVLATAVLRLTALGLFIESIGVNRSASSYAGLRSRSMLIGVYAFAGFCAAIAGIIAAADIRGADANNVGLWLELDAILAVVIGGTSLLGGRFSIPMSVVGALIIQAMNTGILLSGFPPEFNLLVKAALIIVILVVQSPLAGRAGHFFKAQKPAPQKAPTEARSR